MIYSEAKRYYEVNPFLGGSLFCVCVFLYSAGVTRFEFWVKPYGRHPWGWGPFRLTFGTPPPPHKETLTDPNRNISRTRQTPIIETQFQVNTYRPFLTEGPF